MAASSRVKRLEKSPCGYTSATVHELTEGSGPIERQIFDIYRTPRGECTRRIHCPDSALGTRTDTILEGAVVQWMYRGV